MRLQHTLTYLAWLSFALVGCKQVVVPGGGHDFGGSTVVASNPTATADGVQSIDIIVTLADSDGTPISGWSVDLTSTGTKNDIKQPAATSDANGIVTGSIASTAIGEKMITAVPYNGDTRINIAPNNSVKVVFNLPPQSMTLTQFPTTLSAGQSAQARVTLLDANNTSVPDYRGVVAFTSDDPKATLNSGYTFTAVNAGSALISVAFGTVGTHHLTVTDSGNAGLTATMNNIAVTPGPAAKVIVSSPSSNPTVGQAATLNLQVTDVYGNPVTTYSGTVSFTSSDPNAGLPPPYTFNGSTGQVAATLTRSGAQSVSIYDSAHNFLGSASITFAPATTAALVVSGIPTQLNAGAVAGVTVRATDIYGNTTPSYLDTIHFTSNDPLATLPTDYSFQAADNGVHVFTGGVVLKTATLAGSVTATDRITASIFGSEQNITVKSALAATLGVNLASSVKAGVASGVIVTALDAYGNTVASYIDSVHFTSTAVQATLPADYTFNATDSGTHSFTVTFGSSGNQTLHVGDKIATGVVGNANTNVAGGNGTHMTLTNTPSIVNDGQTFQTTVSVFDAYNNLASYTGAVSFTSSDTSATLPAPYTFTMGASADNGAHTFSLAFRTPGTQSFNVRDSQGLSSGSGSITVNPGGVASFAVTGYAATPAAGSSGSVTVRALDMNSNLVTTYRGAVTMTSSDAQATLPATWTFQATDAGVHTFSGITVRTSGNQNIIATDTALGVSGYQSVNVQSGSAVGLSLTGILSATAGTGATFTVKAVDAYGNAATNYTQAVHFNSSDTLATFPSPYTFFSSDRGVHSFVGGIVFKTAGNQNLTVTDGATTPLTNTLSSIMVNAGNASHFVVAGLPPTAAAGTTLSPTVTAQDAFNNVAKTYGGTVHITSTDSNASLPGNYSFTATDAGVHGFNNLVFKTAGAQTINANDLNTPSIAGKSSTVTVGAGSAASFIISNITSPTTACTALSPVVTARDAYGNAVLNYNGQISFSTNDTGTTLPAKYSYTGSENGAHSFTGGVVPKHAPNSTSVSVVDTASATVTGAVTFTVNAGNANNFTVTGLTGGTAPITSSPIVTAIDACANIATNYSGSVTFSSTDPLANLPGLTAFTAAAHTFTNGVTLRTAGSQTITAFDSVSASVSGTSNSATISAVSFVVAQSAPTAGTPISVKVTAQDQAGTTATGYTGVVTFTTTDTAATFSGTQPNMPLYTFTTGDAGVHSFTNGVTYKTAGNQNLAVKDTSAPTRFSNTFVVSPGSASSFTVTGLTTPITAGYGSGFTVTAYDPYANIATGYAGQVTFTSNDPNASLPTTYTFTSGTGTQSFSSAVTFRTPGVMTFTAADTAGTPPAASQNVTVVGAKWISAGGGADHMCAQVGNDVKCWGANASGQLGVGDTTSRGNSAGTSGSNTPITNVAASTSIASGGGSTCAILANGNATCWGVNTLGQLGNGATSAALTTPTGASLAIATNNTGRTVSTTIPQPLAQNANGGCVILDNGKVTCWGYNSVGQIGNNASSTTVPVTTPVAALTFSTATLTANAISVGQSHACAVLSTGTVNCWGFNGLSQLGQGSTVNQPKPTVTSTVINANTIAAGSDHTCAILSTGKVSCWGNFPGNGGTVKTTTPTTITIGASNATAIATAQAITSGTQFTCVILTTGQVACWGTNASGQCGPSSPTSITSAAAAPFAPMTGRTAVALTAGTNYACALMDNNQVTCWGANGATGQLGFGDTTATRTAPTSSASSLW